MAGRKRKDDESKTSKQKRQIIVLETIIEQWLALPEIPFEWFVEIYRSDFGYDGDQDITVENTIKRDLEPLLRQNFIEQTEQIQLVIVKAPIKVSKRLKDIWQHFEEKNRRLTQFLEEKYKDECDEELKEDVMYEEYSENSFSAFDLALQIVQAIITREMSIEKETINRSNRHFFPFDMIVARNY